MRFLLIMLWALWCPIAMWLLVASLHSLEWATGLFFDPELQKYEIMLYCIGIVSALACDGSLAKQQGRPIKVITSYVVAALVSLITMFAGIMIGLGLGLGSSTERINIIVPSRILGLGLDIATVTATELSLALGFILGLVPFLLPWLLWKIWPNPERSML